MSTDVPTYTGWVYKATRTSEDLFVKRFINIQGSKFVTAHDEALQRDHKSYYLDRTCTLEPELATDIDPVPQSKRERPHGQWSITALASGEGKELQLVGGRGRGGDTCMHRYWHMHHARTPCMFP